MPTCGFWDRRSAIGIPAFGASLSVCAMWDSVEGLRREAAVCLGRAELTTNPRVREELISMAARFHELANSAQAELDGTLPAFNEAKPIAQGGSEPAAQQQQQQIQHKKGDD